MKSKQLIAIAIVATAVGLGWSYYKKRKNTDEVEAVKASEIAQVKVPAVATPGILPGEPSPSSLIAVKPATSSLITVKNIELGDGSIRSRLINNLDDYFVI